MLLDDLLPNSPDDLLPRILCDVFVPGKAQPQGSVRPIVTKAGRLAVVHPAKLTEYRARITAALSEAHPLGPPRYPGPCSVAIVYWIDRPAGHYRTGRNAHLLREGAPSRPIGHTTGDADKIARCALDAVTDSCVWLDDSQVVDLTTSKVWTPAVPSVPAGLHLVIRALP